MRLPYQARPGVPRRAARLVGVGERGLRALADERVSDMLPFKNQNGCERKHMLAPADLRMNDFQTTYPAFRPLPERHSPWLRATDSITLPRLGCWPVFPCQ